MLSPRSQQALFTLPAFRNLGAAERKEVAGFFHEIALPKDALIYRAGDVADALYMLVSGAVDVLDGEEVLARYGPGEVFGEAAVFTGEPRAVTRRSLGSPCFDKPTRISRNLARFFARTKRCERVSRASLTGWSRASTSSLRSRLSGHRQAWRRAGCVGG